jgi:hypothetical protein
MGTPLRTAKLSTGTDVKLTDRKFNRIKPSVARLLGSKTPLPGAV